jgi:putative flavoprotein involved in K+ transport
MTSTHFQHPDRVRVERFDTIVIGGGQAGLAVGQQLAAHDIDFVILSNEAQIGDNWRKRWGSLRLFTPARFSGLPAMPFPAPPGHLADKDEVADYLERYAARFDLPVRVNTHVESLTSDGTRFRIIANDGASVMEADNVIVATGPFQRPLVPAVAAQLAPTIHQLHSSQYQDPFDLPDGPVLVVGAGNSGAQIALELAQFRKVWLAGRDTGHMPRRVLGRDVFSWLWPVMKWATAETRLGRRMRADIQRSGDALIGIPEQSLTDSGVVRVGRLDAERGGQPVCGGDVIEPRVIVWCTGYQPDYSWIDLPVCDDAGRPRHVRGVATALPGLFFLGLRFQYRLNSSLIGGVGQDAAFIAGQVAKRSQTMESV